MSPGWCHCCWDQTTHLTEAGFHNGHSLRRSQGWAPVSRSPLPFPPAPPSLTVGVPRAGAPLLPTRSGLEDNYRAVTFPRSFPHRWPPRLTLQGPASAAPGSLIYTDFRLFGRMFVPSRGRGSKSAWAALCWHRKRTGAGFGVKRAEASAAAALLAIGQGDTAPGGAITGCVLVAVACS